jgi:hypothetical protein
MAAVTLFGFGLMNSPIHCSISASDMPGSLLTASSPASTTEAAAGPGHEEPEPLERTSHAVCMAGQWMGHCQLLAPLDLDQRSIIALWSM